MEKVEEKIKWFKISKRISLPINTNKVDPNFIPKDIGFEENKKLMEQAALCISNKTPILLVGETGTGKTSLVRHLAHSTNNAFVRVNLNGATTVEDLLGRWTINSKSETEWIDGILIEAMKKGYWFLADEVNAGTAEVLFILNSLLDDDSRILLAEKGNEVVIPHTNFRFFGAMNPPTEYAGTKQLNKALLSRFMVCKVDFPAPLVEEKILIDRTTNTDIKTGKAIAGSGIDQKIAEKMVRFAAEIRGMHSNEQTHFILSTRDLIMWASMFKIYKKFLTSAEMTVLNKIEVDDFDVIKDVMALHFKTIDDKVSKKEDED